MTPPGPAAAPRGAPHFVRSLRLKVTLTLLAVALIPLLLMSLLHNHYSHRTIKESTRHTLQAAASETVLSLDAFASAKLTAINTEAKLPVLSNYLLSGDTRMGTDVLEVLRSLNRQDPIFIFSSALLNVDGRNVTDTEGGHVGRDESHEPYFASAVETGLASISPVRFDPQTHRPYIALSAPVITPGGKIVGVLRTLYSAHILQQIVVGTSGLAGPGSFAILLDENGLILAYGGASQKRAFQLLYNLARPLPPETLKLLEHDHRMPPAPQVVADPFVEEAADITDFSQGTVAAVEVSLRYLPGRLSFLIPSDAYLQPLRAHRLQTFLLTGAIAAIIVFLALWSAQLFFAPLRSLTLMARSVAGGDLDAKVPVPSGDEIGELAAAFNRMTGQLKDREEERNRLLASEHASRTEAEEANRLKDDFLATLSHELRTPLAAIIGWINLLKNKPEEGELREGLEVIERNAWAETQLVEDLLDVSRIARGQITLNRAALDLAAVVSEAVEAITPAAQARQIRLITDLPEEGACATGDWNRLRQVVLNLLSNAIKFTREGGEVRVRLEAREGRLILSVRDNGVGIPPEHLPYIFNRFMQVDSSSTRRFGGMGLGLPIAWHLIQLHGGTIRAESEGLEKGACFTVELPEDCSGEAPPELKAAQADTLKGRRILLVEDDLDTLGMLRRLLEGAGATVFAARTAASALETFPKAQPDLLVSDIGLPGENGYSLLQRLRSEPEGAALPAVALTAYARDEDERQSLLAGFVAHLSKPVDPARLLAVLASLPGRGDGSDGA